MMESALGRVIIPTFNCGHWIIQAVESVLSQSLAPVEILVVADGAADDTRQHLALSGSRRPF